MENKTAGKPRAAKWRMYAINALILVVVIAGIRIWQHRGVASGAIPSLQGITLKGQPYRLPAEPGKTVLVHFWATWCPVCRAEQGNIAAIARDNPDVITVSMQSGKPQEVIQYMKEQGIDFAVLNDPGNNLARAWGVHGVPTSFIVSPDGQIRFVEVGYTTEIGLRLRMWLASK
jgi:thiol-disulfide isomerase/thioredoxin